jgi:thioredoxin 1
MMQKFSFMMVLLALFGIYSVADTKHINSISEFEEVTKKGNVIVDFYASWCMPCKELSKNIEKLHIDDDYVKIYKVNVELQKELQLRYGTPQVPFLLYIRDGEVVDSYVGSRSTAQLESDIANFFY